MSRKYGDNGTKMTSKTAQISRFHLQNTPQKNLKIPITCGSWLNRTSGARYSLKEGAITDTISPSPRCKKANETVPNELWSASYATETDPIGPQ